MLTELFLCSYIYFYECSILSTKILNIIFPQNKNLLRDSKVG